MNFLFHCYLQITLIWCSMCLFVFSFRWSPSFFLCTWCCVLPQLSLLDGVSKRPHRRAAKFQTLSHLLHFWCSWTGCSPHNHTIIQLFFQLHDGRLCAPTIDSIKLAAKKEFKVDMQWVKNPRSPFPPLPESDSMSGRHPITGTSERYSLYHRFHQKNPKCPEKLRSLNICPTRWNSEVNSSVAEQFSRELASVRYSLCQMNKAHFKQTVRVMIDLHNDKINRGFKAEMEALCSTQLCIGLHGMLGL